MQRTLLLLALGLGLAEAATVSTSTGPVSGSVHKYEGNHRSGDYFRFQGIPYAEPPVGRLRFQDPVGVQPWQDVKDCSGAPPAMCPQMDFFNIDPENPMKVGGSEDCLFLNIYTEELPSVVNNNSPLLKPVLFYIHGGGFTMGQGAGVFGMENSGEDYLLESGLVVVTINYRLGPFGFLALPGTNIQGNMGMKDQLLAMRWVKQNIARFGGDPSRITISGLSAGAVSTHAHVLSPLGEGEGLFHGAVAQSGSMLMNIESERTFEDSRSFFEKVCKVNLTVEELPEDLSTSCLFDETAEAMIKEIVKPMAAWMMPMAERIELEKRDPSYIGYSFWVVVDGYADTPFMPSHPITILHNQQQKMVPFMTGVTSEEGALIVPSMWKDMENDTNVIKENWGWIGARNLFPGQAKHISWELEQQARMVAQFYVGRDGLVREHKEGLMDMFTDAYFAAPNYEAVRLHAKAPAPVYNYLFNFKGSSSFSDFYSFGNPDAKKEDWGVAHGDDAMYLAKLSYKGKQFIATEEERRMVDIYQKLITNFVRYGNPTPVESTTSPIWPPAQKSRAACVYMEINLEPQEKHRMFSERMTFWNMLIFKDLLSEYAVDTKEARLLIEIESAIEEQEGGDLGTDVDDLKEDDERSKEDDDDKGTNKIKRWRQKKMKNTRKQRGRKHGGRWNKKQRKAAKLEAKRRQRLAKKLRSLMD